MIQAKVIRTWQKLSPRERKEIRRRSMRASDAVMRCRCKIILILVQGKTPTMIAQGGLCAKSQVYRVAARFIEHGPVGLADKREDNGENKVTDAYGMELLRLILPPLSSHYTRTAFLLANNASLSSPHVSPPATVGVSLNRPKPTVDCPWPRSRRTRRLRAIQRLVDNLAPSEVALYLDKSTFTSIPSWARLDAGLQKYVRTPGCNEKRYLAGVSIPKPASSHGSKAIGRTASRSWAFFTNS